MIFVGSWVSCQSQIIDRIERLGRETRMAAAKVERLAKMETTAMITPEIRILRRNCTDPVYLALSLKLRKQ